MTATKPTPEQLANVRAYVASDRFWRAPVDVDAVRTLLDAYEATQRLIDPSADAPLRQWAAANMLSVEEHGAAHAPTGSLRAVRVAGQKMANTCFNWAQATGRFDARERAMLKRMYEDWDAALDAIEKQEDSPDGR